MVFKNPTWKSLRRSLVTLKITLSCTPSHEPIEHGKFFRVWLVNDTCIKWTTYSDIQKCVAGLAELLTIYILLESRRLVPSIHALLLDMDSFEAGMVVDKLDILDEVDYKSGRYEALYSALTEIANEYGIRRHPYDELPNRDSFLMEAQGKRNLGVRNGRMMLADVDRKCFVEGQQARYLNRLAKLRISRFLMGELRQKREICGKDRSNG